MSGGVPFERGKLEALADIILAGRPITGDHLATWLFLIDFRAYAARGKSITGSTYCKGHRVPVIREVGEDWPRRFVRSRTPAWERLAGDLIAGTLAVHALVRALR